MAASGKMTQKKIQKRLNLENAAYQLFTTKGFHNTSIHDIVTLANVAKGTFYLYYKDKSDLLDKLIINSSSRILTQAMLYARDKNEDFIERIIIITDYIISYFQKDTAMLAMINKNFSWSLIMDEINQPNGSELQTLFLEYSKGLKQLGYTQEEASHLLFLIVELIGSACYSSILTQHPACMEELKPLLLNTVRKILS